MGERYYSDFEIGHEELYSELERLKAENYHLKRQLRHKNNINSGQSKQIGALEKKLKQENKDKQYFRKGRKRGSRGFNG